MITREEFHAKCQNIISDEDKAKIKKTKKRKIITVIIVFILELALGIVLSINEPPAICANIILMPISYLIIHLIFARKWNEFKQKYSVAILGCMLEGYSFTFNQNACVDQALFRSSCFYSYYDNYSGSDLLTIDIPKDDGKPSGTLLNVSDLRTTKRVTYTNSNGHKEVKNEIVYYGVFGCITFPFRFKCNLLLNHFLPKTNHFKLEDIKFNKKFRVYSNNQLEALVILTPTLMTKLLACSNKVKGFRLALTEDGRLCFGMNRNLFEIKTSKKSLNNIFNRYYDDVSILLSIVDEIKNNNKIFKMWLKKTP